MFDEDNDQLISNAQKAYLDFLDDEENQGVYHKRVKEMIEENRIRLMININDLRNTKPERAEKLLSESAIEQIAFKNALKQYISTLNPGYERDEFHVGFEGSFGHRHLTPRDLTTEYLNNMICIEGIVSECSLVKPKLVQSVHYCPKTERMLERRYTDATSLSSAIPTISAYPTQDPEGNPLETEFGLSMYMDHQMLVLQEMPERAPAGQLPRSVDVICDDDLADKCKPGDRVQIIGLYRSMPAKKGSSTTGVFRNVLIANNIMLLNKELKMALSRTDISNCRKVGKLHNIFEILSRSIAPSIHGHEFVKKAILCMLLGGVEKVLSNGTRLRGDINILLIGDPSVAKSQLLRYVLSSAPRAVATTGRGSSGVGLTAAVTHDRETGEKKLEAGAMVLADRGIVCIDEFDKMSDLDRTAIHEVMEQGRVTIAKAGIHARLNARCSVLAAANPIYGRYDCYRPPMENIGLQDSLLSRFDLLFVLLDNFEADSDSLISDHVVRMHRYRIPSEQDGSVLPMGAGVEFLTTGNLGENANEEGPATVYEKYDPLLHGNSRSKTDKIFSIKFMRMYLHIAKTLKPMLTDEACEAISEEYARLRSQDSIEAGFARTQPVTVRTLETLIRLATAHAKSRLSCEVLLDDAKAAIQLVQYACFKKVVEKESRKRHHSENSDQSDNDGDEAPRKKRAESVYHFNDEEEEATGPFTSDGRRDGSNEVLDVLSSDMFAGREMRGDFSRPEDRASTSDDVIYPASSQSQEVPTAVISIEPSRYELFKKRVATIFAEPNIRSVDLKEFEEKLQEGLGSKSFSKAEIESGLDNMTSDNAIMVTENKVFLI